MTALAIFGLAGWLLAIIFAAAFDSQRRVSDGYRWFSEYQRQRANQLQRMWENAR